MAEEDKTPKEIKKFSKERKELQRAQSEVDFNTDRGLLAAMETAVGEDGFTYNPNDLKPSEMADVYKGFVNSYISGKGGDAIGDLDSISDSSFANALRHGVLPSDNLIHEAAKGLGANFTISNVRNLKPFQQEMEHVKSIRSSDLEKAIRELNPDDVVAYTGIGDSPYKISADRIRDRPDAMGRILGAYEDGNLEDTLMQLGLYEQ